MLTGYLFDSFGLSIIVLTVVINVLMYPLTKKQIESQKKMQSLQGRISEIQKKYAKDKQKASEEQMKLMKESGVSTTGCMVPMIIQMPVFIALYQSIIRLLATAPEGFLNLSQRLYYSWPDVFAAVPLNNHFLWIDLAYPDLILAVLVGASMWLQQKMTTTPSEDPQQRAQAQMMQWMMPLMFGFICLTFLRTSLYWLRVHVNQNHTSVHHRGPGAVSIQLISGRGKPVKYKNCSGYDAAKKITRENPDSQLRL
jgi:YidC/Oxa1 family membrane protein insertase